MKTLEIKKGMTLENTRTTLYIKVISVESWGVIAKEIGDCNGIFQETRIKNYSNSSIKQDFWIIKENILPKLDFYSQTNKKNQIVMGVCVFKRNRLLNA